MRVRTSTAFLALGLATASAPGCKCGSDQPYTPFGMASALPDAEPPPSASAEASASPPAPSAFAPRKSELAPSGTRRWNLAGRTIEAPERRRFEQAVAADFDADGEAEIVAWVRAEEGGPAGKPLPAGELWIYPAAEPPRALLPLPTFVPTGPGCDLSTSLAQTGPRSVTLRTRARCKARLIPRSPTGALVTLAPLAPEPTIVLFRLAEPAPGEELDYRVVSDDRDGDGRDDAVLHAELTTGGKSVGAELTFFDRAAGASRDPNEPSKSLGRAASREAFRAKQKKTAAEVVERVAALRRLAFALCAESGTPRIFDRDGTPLPCRGLSGFVDSLAQAEIQAELARAEVVDAFAAHSRDGHYLGAASAKLNAQLEKELLGAVTQRTLRPPLALDVTALVPATPHFSPLSFEGGALVVQTGSGPVHFAADGSRIPSDDGGAARPLDVTDGPARLLQVIWSCERSEVTLAFAGAPELATPVLAARPGACAGAKFTPIPAPHPNPFAGGKLEALIGGTRVGTADTLPSAGSPRSSDGRWLAVPTRLGLLVSGEKNELWTLPALAPRPTELSECVVENDRARAACIAAGRVFLLQPE